MVFREDLSTFDDIDELPDVARPIVRFERSQRVGSNVPVGAEEVLDQQRDVAGSRSQRWQAV